MSALSQASPCRITNITAINRAYRASTQHLPHPQDSIKKTNTNYRPQGKHTTPLSLATQFTV
ncbi:hypothetical protein [Bartonella queenslandensis]|uniref:hypothetical protein n=1 Tax=Bartonella queenslandensis TaxID=481138 RepID=UPI001BADFCA6|nr:hypothetical protein [Bartonella queenslandensis]